MPDLPVEQLISELDNILNHKFLEFDADSIRCSSNPYQNLVHQYQLNKKFQEIGDMVTKKLPGFQLKDEIHISLMYGKVKCEDLEDLIEELEQVLPTKIRVSEYQIIRAEGRVEQWKTLHRQTF